MLKCNRSIIVQAVVPSSSRHNQPGAKGSKESRVFKMVSMGSPLFPIFIFLSLVRSFCSPFFLLSSVLSFIPVGLSGRSMEMDKGG